MNKYKLYLILVWAFLMPMLLRSQEFWFSADSANFEFTRMVDVKKAVKKWQRQWVAIDTRSKLLLPNEQDLNSALVLPYFRIFPDTLRNVLRHEYRREKIAMVTPGERVYYWYLEPEKGLNQLAIGPIIPDTFRLMLSAVSGKKNVHLVYLIEAESQGIPIYSRSGNLSMMLGYAENGRDVFLDKDLCVYHSVEDAINARYGGMDKYIMYYRRGYVNKQEFVR